MSAYAPIKRTERHAITGPISAQGDPVCATGKYVFASRKVARRFIRSHPELRHHREYQCPHCKHWHTTSQAARS
jgi:hypothetical protein